MKNNILITTAGTTIINDDDDGVGGGGGGGSSKKRIRYINNQNQILHMLCADCRCGKGKSECYA